jgi:hypothetical protein
MCRWMRTYPEHAPARTNKDFRIGCERSWKNSFDAVYWSDLSSAGFVCTPRLHGASPAFELQHFHHSDPNGKVLDLFRRLTRIRLCKLVRADISLSTSRCCGDTVRDREDFSSLVRIEPDGNVTKLISMDNSVVFNWRGLSALRNIFLLSLRQCRR